MIYNGYQSPKPKSCKLIKCKIRFNKSILTKWNFKHSNPNQLSLIWIVQRQTQQSMIVYVILDRVPHRPVIIRKILNECDKMKVIHIFPFTMAFVLLMAFINFTVLDGAATISAVLYANTAHPELKIDYPNWDERVKQILKKWRALSNEKRAPFLQRARENRSCLRKNNQVSGFVL